MSLRPPPSLFQYARLSDGELFRVIDQGYGVMPSYNDRLSPRDTWAVVAFLRALQLSHKATLADAPPDVRQALEKAP
jgi:hypothetical protein